MDNNLLFSIAFPGDTYQNILLDLDELMSHNLDDTWTIRHKSIVFMSYFSHCITKLCGKSMKEVYKEFYGDDYNLIHPKYFAELFFDSKSVDFILQFLKNYDNAYFWEAFGISLDKGNAFLKRLNYIDERENTLQEIRNEIVESNSVKREIIINELTYYLLVGSDSQMTSSKEFVSILLNVYKVALQYGSIKEALNLCFGDDIYFDIISFIKNFSPNLKSNDVLDQESLFELIKIAYIFCDLGIYVNNINNHYNSDDINKMVLLNSFKLHKYGYEAYQVYLNGCKIYNLEPVFDVGNSPELYFYNSYKVPQLPSLYKRYFDGVSEEKAKEKTEKCFKKIYTELNKQGFLDDDCLNEFMWAFGLTDKYPHGFKRIAFHTSREKKANGAFLALLKILGYEEDEIKEMRQERKNKPNLINQIFDLTLSRKTKESKDCLDLLKIVEDSGLPVKG